MNEPAAAWKEQVLADFRTWLDTLPDDPPGQEPDAVAAEGPPGTDLHALLVELAALRQEVKLQNREQGRASRELQRATDEGAEERKLFRAASLDLAALDARLRAEAARHCLVPLLDVRDALVRGRDAAARIVSRRGFLFHPPRGSEEVVTGYDLAIERFDRGLAAQGVRRIVALGQPFEPRTMTALESRDEPHEPDGIVLAEVRSGFLLAEEVLRPAEVVVNRTRPTGRRGPEAA